MRAPQIRERVQVLTFTVKDIHGNDVTHMVMPSMADYSPFSQPRALCGKLFMPDDALFDPTGTKPTCGSCKRSRESIHRALFPEQSN